MKYRIINYVKLLLTLIVLFFSYHSFAVIGGSGSGTGTGTGTGSPSSSSSRAVSNSGSKSSNSNIKAYVDKNKDGKLSQEEIMSSIDEYFDGNSPFKIEELQGLIDTFFDE